MIELSPDDLARIRAHGEATYPEECCGILVGSTEKATGGNGVVLARVVRLVGAENTREDENRHNRYLIPPEVILRTEREARADGLDVVGYYHSHPDHPSRPSDFDRDHAWPGYSYLIVSVREGRARDERSWRLSDDRSRFDEEPIQCPESGAP
ncbi:MAG: M67 family metallopeptidase [Acidobacteria bacterium]|nr:M67 family metallopeptidase [Acidobacteriota bacterium]